MRLIPTMTQQYFVLLAYLRFRIGGDFPSIYSDLYNYYREGRIKDPLIVRALHKAGIEDQNPKHSLEELIEFFKNRIAYPPNASEEGDLIDLLLEALNSPYGQNVLTGKTLASLRKSLMQPEELVAFKERIRNNKVGCAGCGVELEEREAITLSIDKGQVTLYCSLCLQATNVACPGCRKKVPFSERYTTKKWKDCSSHDNGDKRVDEVAPKKALDPDVMNWAQRAMANAREGRRAAPVRVRPGPPEPRVPVAPPQAQFYGGEAPQQAADQLPQYGDAVPPFNYNVQDNIVVNYHFPPAQAQLNDLEPQPLNDGLLPRADAAMAEIENIDLDDDPFMPLVDDDDDGPDEGN